MRLTDRDRQLLAVLAQARCLSSAQVKRLFWPGQVERVMRRRLHQLSTDARALVQQVTWFTREGQRTAWGLTPAGYLEAEAELEEEVQVPREDVGVEYLEHHVHLSEVLVGLLEARVAERAAKASGLVGTARNRALSAAHARARHPRFRWTVAAATELPWKEPAGAGGALQARVIRPDAILELPEVRRRLFVESEMGTHTIEAVSASKQGATLAKVARYEAFASGLASVQPRRTWYQARFPDGAPPEVLFLVRSEGRAASVRRALDGWRAAHPQASCSFSVATVEAALAQLLPLVGARAHAEAPTAKPQAAQLQPAEAALVRRFFQAVEGDFKARRQAARVQRGHVPDYPPGMAEMHELVRRLPA